MIHKWFLTWMALGWYLDGLWRFMIYRIMSIAIVFFIVFHECAFWTVIIYQPFFSEECIPMFVGWNVLLLVIVCILLGFLTFCLWNSQCFFLFIGTVQFVCWKNSFINSNDHWVSQVYVESHWSCLFLGCQSSPKMARYQVTQVEEQLLAAFWPGFRVT